MRLLLLVVLVSASSACGDDEDPATSQRCKDARAEWLGLKQQRDRALQAATAAGLVSRAVPAIEQQMASIENENWDCFH